MKYFEEVSMDECKKEEIIGFLVEKRQEVVMYHVEQLIAGLEIDDDIVDDFIDACVDGFEKAAREMTLNELRMQVHNPVKED